MVALTGATGFIGGHVRRRLLAGGASLRALARTVPGGGEPGVEWIRGDVRDPAALARLVDGATFVIHSAGTVRGATAGDFEAVNVGGTRSLARAALDSGSVRRFLFLSSLAAREPALSWYAESKRRAETALAEVAGDRLPWTAFRPTAVYGPGDREMRPLFHLMRRGVLPVMGRPDARLTLLHVDDLARAVAAWARTPGPVRGVHEVHDGTVGGYTWTEVARIAGEAWGRKVRTVPVPAGFLAVLARANVGLARLVGRAPMLTPGKVRELRHPDWTCEGRGLAEVLDWEPRLDLARALRAGRVLSS